MKKIFWTLLCAAMLAALLCGALAESDTLKLPADLTTIDEEAFFGDTSVDTVVLPDTVAEIRARAFAGSSLRAINLPDSLTFIDDTAFDGPDKVSVTVNKGSYAYEWAVKKGYIEEYPESEHPYEPGKDQTWSYTYPGEAEFLKVTFSSETSFAYDSEDESDDRFTITDETGDSLVFECDDLKGETVYLKGRSFELYLKAYSAYPEYYVEGYGFRITNIEPATAEEYDSYWSVCEFITEEWDDGTLAITGYEGPSRDVVIPATIDGKEVSIIGPEAFRRSNIRSVRMPNTLKWISMYAFEYCENLKYLEISQSVEFIENFAFNGCTALEEIVIPGTVYVQKHAFEPDPDDWGEGMSEKLRSITISNSGTNLDLSTLSRFPNLPEYIVYGDNTTYSTIDGALYDAAKTTLIKCPSGKTGEYVLPDGITKIGDKAFIYCWKLTKVMIPDTVTELGENLFGACNSLTQVRLPDTVTRIGTNMFYNCDSLTEFTFPRDTETIGMYAFGSCDSLTEVTIPDGVTSIEYGAFGDCANLTRVTIPSSVTEIDDEAFQWCSEDLTLYVQAGSAAETFAIEKGIRFETTGSNYTVANGVITGYQGVGGRIVIPSTHIDGSSITAIGEGAFSGNKVISSITVSEGIKEIRAGAFANSKLYEIHLPDSLTDIADTAFDGPDRVAIVASAGSGAHSWAVARGYYDCSAFKSTLLPDDTLSITKYIGSDTDVSIPSSIGWATVTSIGEGAFEYCRSVTSVTIPDGVTSIGDWAFRDCSSLTSVTIPGSVTSIGEGAFDGCSVLASVTIPNGVTSIGDWAFSDCSGLTSVTIPDSVTSIGELAFSDCSSLTSVTISNGVTSIGADAFLRCSSLTSVTIPGSVTSIGDSAFEDCSSLTSVTISNGVTSIEYGAFSGCSSLTSVTIPDSVTSIGDSAFDDCSESLVIYGKAGSYAETYATENGIAFVAE